MPPEKLRILLVEDDELFRLGLRVRLQEEIGLEIVAEAEDGDTAVELAARHQLDIVLLDLALPGIGGIEACRQINEQQPSLPILVLTSVYQKSLVTQLIQVGVQGYCLKGIAAETLVWAIRSVAAGASWWDKTATTEIRAAVKSNTSNVKELAPAQKLAASLSRREQEVLAMLAAGKSNQEIASHLYIAPTTVRVHIHTILQKLNVRSRTQAVVLAIQEQLV